MPGERAINEQLEELAYRETMLRRAAEKMLAEADRLRKLQDGIAAQLRELEAGRGGESKDQSKPDGKSS